MPLAQRKIPPRYRNECRRCHGSAAGLVRDSTDLENGIMHSADTGRAINDFLPGHRGLSQADAEFFGALLLRGAREVIRP